MSKRVGQGPRDGVVRREDPNLRIFSYKKNYSSIEHPATWIMGAPSRVMLKPRLENNLSGTV